MLIIFTERCKWTIIWTSKTVKGMTFVKSSKKAWDTATSKKRTSSVKQRHEMGGIRFAKKTDIYVTAQ